MKFSNSMKPLVSNDLSPVSLASFPEDPDALPSLSSSPSSDSAKRIPPGEMVGPMIEIDAAFSDGSKKTWALIWFLDVKGIGAVSLPRAAVGPIIHNKTITRQTILLI